MDDPDITWRNAKPDYKIVNEKYLKEKTCNHAPNSLEKIIENAVKTWEMEASHKINPKDWGSVNTDKFLISANHGTKYNIEELIKVGTYNGLIDHLALYDNNKET